MAHLAGTPPPPTDWPSVAMQCTNWRGAGQKIAFANGCFDLLHPGHIHLLNEAAGNADRLVVGLNGDASVRRLKGAGRPHQSAELRSAVLAALPFVDAVAVFDEDTPFDLIATLQPDIIVKGGDYVADQVVGGDIVAARGGQVLIISTLDGHATSKLITRLAHKKRCVPPLAKHTALSSDGMASRFFDFPNAAHLCLQEPPRMIAGACRLKSTQQLLTSCEPEIAGMIRPVRMPRTICCITPRVIAPATIVGAKAT